MLLLDIHEKSNGLNRKYFSNLVRLMVFIGLGLSVGTSLIAQEKCGTVFTEQMKQEIMKRVEDGRKKKNQKSNQMRVFTVQPYIMKRDDTNEIALDPDMLFSKMAALNGAFFEANIQFEFCESVKFIKCNSTFDISLISVLDNLYSSHKINSAIPIFFVNELSIFGNEANGIAQPFNYIAVSKRSNTNRAAQTLIHEMGHYFGLQHTFTHKSNFEVARPTHHNGELIYYDSDGTRVEGLRGQNCNAVADGFCDTSADYLLYNGQVSCDEIDHAHEEIRESNQLYREYNPPLDNFMSYYPCRNRFSTEQLQFLNNSANSADYFPNGTFEECVFSRDSDYVPLFCHHEVQTHDYMCRGFCDVDLVDDFLAINCNTVAIESGDGFIRPEFLRVFNLSENPVHNVNVIFNFVEHPYDLHTVTIGSIAAGNFFDVHHLFNSQHDLFEQGGISTIGVENGQYTLELRIEHTRDGHSQPETFYICQSNQRIDVYNPPEDPCAQQIIRQNPIGANRTVRDEAEKFVELRPGFLADSGQSTKYSALIEPCSNAVQDESEVSSQKALTADNTDASSPVAESSSLQRTIDPDLFESFQVSNYPNPFSEKSTIELVLDKTDQVRISLSDVNGKFLGDIMETGKLSKGSHQFTVDGSKYQPGIYYYTVIVGSEQQTGKMILIK